MFRKISLLTAIFLKVAVAANSFADKLTCEECTDIANQVCDWGSSETAIRGMAQMIREDVCSVMPTEYECDMHFDVYWNAIVMAMTDPTDGYWSASHLCKDLNECPGEKSAVGSKVECRLCDQALSYHMYLGIGNIDVILNMLNEKENVIFFDFENKFR